VGDPVIAIALTVITRDPDVVKRLRDAARLGHGVTITRDDFTPDLHVENVAFINPKGV
jgi:hypothetical protein